MKRLFLAVALSLLLVPCLAGRAASEDIPDYSQTERAGVPESLRWRIEDLYPDVGAWRADLAAARAETEALASMAGEWTSTPQRMADFLERYEGLVTRGGRLHLYATLQAETGQTHPEFRSMLGEANRFYADMTARLAFVDTGILRMGRTGVEERLKTEPRLVPYRVLFEQVLRKSDHIRSEEVEEVMAMVEPVTSAPFAAASLLRYSDLPGPEATLPDGTRVVLDDAEERRLRRSEDAAERRLAAEAVARNRERYKNTFAALLDGTVNRDLFEARVRRHPDVLTAELFRYGVDPAVYRNLVRTVRGNLGPFHRLLRLRKKMLGLREMRYHDVSLPVASGPRQRIPFEEARRLVLEATAPLGPEYAAPLRRAFEERWLDVYPHKDKNPGGSSSFTRGAHSYVLLNFGGSVFDTRTLAHELGHALHYYMADTSQPFGSAEPSWFLSEVPSNFNEILLMEHQRAAEGDDRIRLKVLSDLLDMLYFNIYHVTLWAEFDLAIHERVEQGGTLTPDWLNERYLELVRHYYGHDRGITVVDDRVGSEWVEVLHFHRRYSAYLYAIGAVTSLSLADSVLKGGEPEAKRYLEFLKAGGSRPPLDLLNGMGVDLTGPGSVERALGVFDGMVAEMEKVSERVAKRGRR